MALDVTQALYALLTADTAVAALVAARVHPGFLPQGATLPAIAQTRISGQDVDTLAGSNGLAHARIQVSCWAATYAGAAALGDAVRLALHGYQGTVTVGANSLVVQSIRLQDQGDQPEPSPGHEQDRRYGRRLDFEIYHLITRPSFD